MKTFKGTEANFDKFKYIWFPTLDFFINGREEI